MGMGWGTPSRMRFASSRDFRSMRLILFKFIKWERSILAKGGKGRIFS